MSLNFRLKIESYFIKYATSPTNPSIVVKGKSYWLPNDRTNRYAELFFRPNGSVLPDDIMRHEYGIDVAKLYYYISDFQNVIDLLRNESPLVFVLTDTGRSLSSPNGIYSDEERIGEGDGEEIPIFYRHPEVPA